MAEQIAIALGVIACLALLIFVLADYYELPDPPDSDVQVDKLSDGRFAIVFTCTCGERCSMVVADFFDFDCRMRGAHGACFRNPIAGAVYRAMEKADG